YTRQLLALYEGPSTGDDYRGFEWHFLNQQLHQETCSIDAHPGFAIMDVAIPPPNTPFEFATLGGGGLLRIWTMNGIMKREVSLGPSGGYCMDYNDDGRLIAVGSKSGEIRFFEAKTLKQEKRVKVGSDDIFDIDLCPQNDWGEMCIVRNNKGAILSINVETDDVKMIAPALTLQGGKPLQEDYWNPRRRFACEVGGKYLAFNDPDGIAIWDLERGSLKYEVKGTETRSSSLINGGPVAHLAPALALTRAGGTSRSWLNLVLGNRVGEISKWNAFDNISHDRFHQHSAAVDHVIERFSRRGFGNFTVSAGRDGVIRIQENQGGRRILQRHETPVCCLAVDPRNNFVVSATKAGELKVSPLEVKRNPRIHNSQAQNILAFHPLNSSYAFATSRDIQKEGQKLSLEIWLYAGQPTHTLTGHEWYVTCLTFHPKGKQLVAGLRDGTIYIWNPSTGEYLRSWKAHKQLIQTLAYTPDGTRLASISYDNQLKVSDTNTGEIIQTIPCPFMTGSRLTWNNDGTRIVAGTLDGRSTVIDVASGKTVLTLPGGSGIYTPDGKQILYIEGPDGKRTNGKNIIACDALTGKEIKRFEGHKTLVSDLIVNADGQRLISLDRGKKIAIWNMNTGTKIMNLQPTNVKRLHSESTSHKVHISPDGRTLAYQGFSTTTVWSTGKIADPSQAEESP
ncbi:WD40 repeat domain-containing protein, partial [Pseudomonadales bacterium]|nr:WD40 repeat domain-containing protein [Pseudomonadales bacterium]